MVLSEEQADVWFDKYQRLIYDIYGIYDNTKTLSLLIHRIAKHATGMAERLDEKLKAIGEL
jgi:hypothetical protein